MTGGEIAGNTASRTGGGVSIDNGLSSFANSGVFTMTGGKINGNISGYGGGVSVGNGMDAGRGSSGIFTMTGGEITGNTASRNGVGSGVHLFGGAFTLGGTAVIKGNASNNVYLANGRYITLSTENPPIPGMNVGVTAYGSAIVSSGARAEDTMRFHPDESGKVITYLNNRLFVLNDGPFVNFYQQVALYEFASDDETIMVAWDMTLKNTTISANTRGATLTIKSANPQSPVTLTRDVDGSLFTVNRGAKLILEDIIIDGNKDDYPKNRGSLVNVNGGEFIIKDGAVLANNSGGGVYVDRGAFTMNGGKITGNTALYDGGGVCVGGGTFNINLNNPPLATNSNYYIL